MRNARSFKKVASVLAVLAGGICIWAGTAAADNPSIFGWWTSTNPGVSGDVPGGPIPTLVPSGGSSGLPSDVPPGGFEVSNLPGDSSYAAIGYFTYGANVSQVVLDIDTQGANIPNSQFEACPLTGGATFSSANGAPLSQGPPYDCSGSVVPGIENPAGTAVAFNVAPLVTGEYLGIAIVAVGQSREVFEAPGQDTVQILPPPAAVGSSTTESTSVAPRTSYQGTPPVGSTIPAQPNQQTPSQPHEQTPSQPQEQNPANPQQLAPAPVIPVSPEFQAATLRSSSLGIGSVVVGAVLILFGALIVMTMNDRALAAVRAATGRDETPTA
jgi:hypothetical protein